MVLGSAPLPDVTLLLQNTLDGELEFDRVDRKTNVPGRAAVPGIWLCSACDRGSLIYVHAALKIRLPRINTLLSRRGFEMPFSGIVDPDQLSALTDALDRYCAENNVSDPDERLYLARLGIVVTENGAGTSQEIFEKIVAIASANPFPGIKKPKG